MTIDRRPIYWMNVYAQHQPQTDEDRETDTLRPWPGNPSGMNPNWRNEPDIAMRQECLRGDRLMLRCGGFPTHTGDTGDPDDTLSRHRMPPSSCWHNLDPSLREVMVQAVVRRKRENENVTFGIYIGCRFGSEFTTDMSQATHVPDLSDLDDRKRFDATIMPWLGTGALYEVGFDSAAHLMNYDAILRLADRLEASYGLHVVIEAYPHTLGSGSWPGNIEWMPMDNGVAYWCLSQFIEPRDPDGNLTVDPATTEVHVANHPTHEMSRKRIGDYRNRGFIVGSSRPRLDWSVDTLRSTGDSDE